MKPGASSGSPYMAIPCAGSAARLAGASAASPSTNRAQILEMPILSRDSARHARMHLSPPLILRRLLALLDRFLACMKPASTTDAPPSGGAFFIHRLRSHPPNLSTAHLPCSLSDPAFPFRSRALLISPHADHHVNCCPIRAPACH